MKIGKKIIIVFIIFIINCVFLINGMVNAEENDYFKGSTYGYIAKEITLNNENLIALSIDNDLMLLKDDKVINKFSLSGEVIFIDVIKDSNENNYDELLIITNSLDDDSILFYDMKDNNLLWTYSFKKEVYDKAMGYYKQTLIITDYTINDDSIVFISCYSAFKLDLKGKLLWQYDDDYTLNKIEPLGDINNDNIIDYALANTNSKVITISGKNGNLIYGKKVSDDLKFSYYTDETDIWDLDYDNSANILYATSENGYIYRLNPATGVIIDKKMISEINEQILYSLINYKLLSSEIISDINNDGVNDLLYYQYTKPNIYNINNVIYHDNLESKIIILSGYDLSVIHETDSFKDNYGTSYLRGTYDNEDVFYFLDDYNNKQISYKIFSLKTGSYLEELVNLNIDLHEENMNDNFTFIQYGNDKYVINNNYGINLFDIDGSKISLLNKMTYEDFIISDDKKYILKSNTNSEKFMYIEAFDKYKNDYLWQYKLSNEDYIFSGGFKVVEYDHDFNNDQINEVVLLVESTYNYHYDNIITQPIIITLDGKTGDELNRFSVVFPENDINIDDNTTYNEYLLFTGYYTLNANTSRVGVIDDLNNDGIKDFYAINRFGDIFFFDLCNGVLLNYYLSNKDINLKDTTHLSDININYTIYGNDYNNDNKRDFLYLTENKLKLVEISDGEIIYDENKLELSSFDGYIISNFNYLGDIDNDGIDDYYFFSASDNKYYLHIILSKTGKIMKTIECNEYKNIINSNYDLNEDGYNELLIYSLDYFDSNFYKIVDVFNNHEYFYYNDFDTRYYNVSNNHVIFKDNGKYYFALCVKNSDMSVYLEIYDIISNQLVRNIQLKKENQRYSYNDIREVGNINLFIKNNEIFLFSYLGNYGNITRAYNFSKDEIYFDYLDNISKIDVVDDSLIIDSQFISNIVINNNFEIINIKENQKVNKNFNVKFTNENNQQVYIYVDDILVGKTHDNHFELFILEGKHTIKVSYIDNKLEVYKTVDVIVEKNYFIIIFIPVITITLFALTIILPRKKRKYKIPTSLVEGSDGNE